jgi:hypothetical protein
MWIVEKGSITDKKYDQTTKRIVATIDVEN